MVFNLPDETIRDVLRDIVLPGMVLAAIVGVVLKTGILTGFHF